MDLKHIGKQYEKPELNENELLDDPILQFKQWMQLAIDSQVLYANAATLSTIREDGFPQGRIILIKEILNDGVTFFTNYNSAKGNEIEKHPKVAINIHWKELDRQVRLHGTAIKISQEASKKYFYSRPKTSQINALISPQSEVILREHLHHKAQEAMQRYRDKDVDYPPNWGGYTVSIEGIEFWQGRPDRLHDRFIYLKLQKKWQIQRLAP